MSIIGGSLPISSSLSSVKVQVKVLNKAINQVYQLGTGGFAKKAEPLFYHVWKYPLNYAVVLPESVLVKKTAKN